MKRRFAIFGLVLLVAGTLLLFWHPWSSTTEPTPLAEKPATRPLVEPRSVALNLPRSKRRHQVQQQQRLHQRRAALSADASSTR